MSRILLVASLLVAGSWWLFEWELAHGASLAEARTAALNVFVVVEAFYLFSCRSLTQSAWCIGFFTNRRLIVGVVAQALAQLTITYLPMMNTVFGTAPLGGEVWLRIFALAVVVSLVVAAEKWLRSRQRAVRTAVDSAGPR